MNKQSILGQRTHNSHLADSNVIAASQHELKKKKEFSSVAVKMEPARGSQRGHGPTLLLHDFTQSKNTLSHRVWPAADHGHLNFPSSDHTWWLAHVTRRRASVSYLVCVCVCVPRERMERGSRRGRGFRFNKPGKTEKMVQIKAVCRHGECVKLRLSLQVVTRGFKVSGCSSHGGGETE